MDDSRNFGRTHNSGTSNYIGQAQLLLSFGLTNTTFLSRSHVPIIAPDAIATIKDSTRILAYKKITNAYVFFPLTCSF